MKTIFQKITSIKFYQNKTKMPLPKLDIKILAKDFNTNELTPDNLTPEEETTKQMKFFEYGTNKEDKKSETTKQIDKGYLDELYAKGDLEFDTKPFTKKHETKIPTAEEKIYFI